jgi:phosphoribosyl 1,2-cyclic phosphodiesterase
MSKPPREVINSGPLPVTNATRHPVTNDPPRLRFWGVRGSIAVPGPSTLRYGGNTSCVELRCGPHLVILDAGSGLLGLSQTLQGWTQAGPPGGGSPGGGSPGGAPPGGGSLGPVDADVLLSHTHMDHICGLPFFTPAFVPGTRLRLHAGHLKTMTLETAVGASLGHPMMPDLMPLMRDQLAFRDFAAGDGFALQAGLRVTTAPLCHPGGATAYRIAWRGRSVAYVTDHEHGLKATDAALLALVRNAEVMICDATYTDAELPMRAGWGHSTWQGALRLADAAGVGRVVLFHHDLARDDAALDVIGAAAEQVRPGTLVGREGMELTV